MGVSVCLSTYPGVAQRGDSGDPKSEPQSFGEGGGFPRWDPGQTRGGVVKAPAPETCRRVFLIYWPMPTNTLGTPDDLSFVKMGNDQMCLVIRGGKPWRQRM